MFVANETVRDKNAEFQYLRWRVAAGEDPPTLIDELKDWSATPRRAPRHESVAGEHAGILTTHNYGVLDDALRSRVNEMYDILWCTATPSSVNVTATAILHLGVTDLREGEGWRKLASMPICNDCHARLDYGVQYFQGFQSFFHAIDYQPALQLHGRGPLYGNGINDLLGEADTLAARLLLRWRWRRRNSQELHDLRRVEGRVPRLRVPRGRARAAGRVDSGNPSVKSLDEDRALLRLQKTRRPKPIPSATLTSRQPRRAG